MVRRADLLRRSDSTGHLQPHPQKSPLLSPSDICDPSPIASSNGTDTTDIDDTAMEVGAEATQSQEQEEDQSTPSDKTNVKVGRSAFVFH